MKFFNSKSLLLAFLLFFLTTIGTIAQVPNGSGSGTPEGNWPFVFSGSGAGDLVSVMGATNLGTATSPFGDLYLSGSAVVLGSITAGGITLTAPTDMDGYDVIMDVDGDSGFVNDRDAGISDDEIGIKLSNAIDFIFSANIFTAESGSTIATDSLSATTTKITINDDVDIDGSIAVKSTTISSATGNISEGDGYVRVKYTDTGTVALTLHNISRNDTEHCIKDSDYNASTNTITIIADASDTVEEAESITITTNGGIKCVKADSDSNNWEAK